MGLPIPVLESWSGSRSPLPVVSVLDQYLNELSNLQVGPVLLVLDDVHLVIETAEIAYLLDRLITCLPKSVGQVASYKSKCPRSSVD